MQLAAHGCEASGLGRILRRCMTACDIEDLVATKKRAAGLSVRPLRVLSDTGQSSHQHNARKWTRLTLTFNPTSVDARASHQNIVDNGEDTFASYPLSCFILDLTVAENGGFVQLDSPPVNGLGKWYLVRVEVFPARPSNHIFGPVTKYISYRV